MLIVSLFGILMGGLIVLIPLVSFCARFALRPILQTLAETRGEKAAERQAALLDRRVDLLEAEVQALQSALGRIEEVEEFRRKLGEGRAAEGERQG